jgi:hypothetical protein
MVMRRRAYLWIEGFSCSPSQVSEILDLEPTSVWLAGETVLQGNRVAPRNAWQRDSSLGPEARLDEHIGHLATLFRERLPRLRAQVEADVGLNCVDEFLEYQGNGFHLSAHLIRELAQLGISVDFDLYGSPD